MVQFVHMQIPLDLFKFSALIILGAELWAITILSVALVFVEPKKKKKESFHFVKFTTVSLLLCWFLLLFSLGRANIFQATGELGLMTLAPLIAIFLPVVIYFICYNKYPMFQRLVHALPQWLLLGMHAFRVIGGLFLVFFVFGLLHPLFAEPAGWGDLLAAALALPAAIISTISFRYKKTLLYWFHAIGLLDFLIAISLGFYATVFLYPANNAIGMIPLVWIPTFGVPLLIILHILSVQKLHLEK